MRQRHAQSEACRHRVCCSACGCGCSCCCCVLAWLMEAARGCMLPLPLLLLAPPLLRRCIRAAGRGTGQGPRAAGHLGLQER